MFRQHAGYARFAYNWALGEFKAGLDMGEWLSDKTFRPWWNRVKNIIAPWNRELSQNAAKCAIIDMGQAASRWGQYRSQRKRGVNAGGSGSRGSSGAGTSRDFVPTTARTPSA